MNVYRPDVAVIGGGVIGTSVTWFLTRAGVSVTLIERNGIASGTSGRCEGNVLIQDKAPGYDSDLCRLSQALFDLVASEVGDDIHWRRTGSVLAAENDRELEAAAAYCRRMSDAGVPVRMMDYREIHEDLPHLAEDIPGGLEFPTDGTVNPMALAGALAADACRRGAGLMVNSEVEDIHRDPHDGVFRIRTRNGVVITPAVVNAAGVWAAPIGRMVGLDIPIQPRQGQILVTERTLPVARRAMLEFGYLMAKFGGHDYVRQIPPDMEEFGVACVMEPTEAGNFLIGSCRRFAGMNTSVDVRVLRALAERAVRFFPVLRRVQVIRSYAGLRPFTPDHFPIISKTRIPGFFVAAGHEGDGIGLSLITGKLMMQLVTGRPVDISVEPLRLERFGGGATA
jgi:sarcosine oxidase subunit beta